MNLKDKNFRVIRGNEWVFENSYIEDDEGIKKNCTDHDAVMVVKKRRSLLAPVVLKVDIVWEDIEIGKGLFTFLPVNTKEVKPGRCYYECYLYKADGTYNKTFARGVLRIRSTVDYPIVSE